MKDVTSTSFGLVIAYILPGMVIVYTLGLFLPPVRDSLRLVMSAQANASLLTTLVGCSLFAGLILHGVRFCLYERWFVRDESKSPQPADKETGAASKASRNDDEFKKLADKDKLEAFRAAVDETYRYHQWWGGLSVATPIAYSGWLSTTWNTLPCGWLIGSSAACAVFECLFVYAAIFVLKQYRTRRVNILEGESDGRLG